MATSPEASAGEDYEEQLPTALDLRPLQIDLLVARKLFTHSPSYPKGGMLQMLLNNKRLKLVRRALVEIPDEAESTI